MKFCPECGAKYAGGGKCKSCGKRFAPDTISVEEANELRLFRDFDLERTEENGIRLISCRNREIEDFVAPPTVTEIAHSCFASCTALYEVDLSQTAIKELPNNCFSGCTELFTVVLPQTLETIEWQAFVGCSNLSEILLPERLRAIGGAAFAGCTSLGEINLPSSLMRAGENAFSGCTDLFEVSITDLAAFCAIEFENPEANPVFFSGSLTLGGEDIVDLVIPASVKKTLPFSFVNCEDIESLHIPSSAEIDPLSFLGCDFLETVTVEKENHWYRCVSNTVLSSDGKRLIFSATSAEVMQGFPASIEEVGPGAFCACRSIEELHFPPKVRLMEGALYGCETLESLTLSLRPGGISTLEELYRVQAFHCWRSLTFYGKLSPLREVTITEAATLDGRFFRGFSDVTRVTLPKVMELLPGFVFAELSLDMLVIPKGIAEIRPPFYGYCVKRLTVEAGGRYAIRDGCLVDPKAGILLSALGKEKVPAGIKHIAAYAFARNGATVLRVPEGVERIDSGAFAKCPNLRELYLPKSIKRLHGSMLEGSTAMRLLSIGDAKGFWSARHGYGTQCVLLEEAHALTTVNPNGSSIDVIVRGHIPKNEWHRIPDGDYDD